MKAVILLRCDGRIDDGFRFCSGVSNVIVDLEHLVHTDNFKQLVMYLDRVPKLFDGRCLNGNVIGNTIYKIFELGYISEVKYKYIAQFYDFHKRCGLILEAGVKEDS